MMTLTATPPRCPPNPTTVKLGEFLVFCIRQIKEGKQKKEKPFISFTNCWPKKLHSSFKK
jgi:hypothetical protein